MGRLRSVDLLLKIKILYYTLRHLKFEQLLFRFYRHFTRTRFRDFYGFERRALPGNFIEPIGRPKTISGRTISFLNETAYLSQSIWDETDRSELWIYNLHYFDDLNNADTRMRFETHSQLVNDWLQNYQFHPNRLGWHPYPVSKRIVNWIKWDLQFSALSQEALDSLASQANFLSHQLEKDLMANHLFVNGKALIFAGLYLEGLAAESWLKIGISIVKEQLDEQVLRDGGQFERSPMYHAECVEDILDLINILRCYKRSLLTHDLETRVLEMLKWSQVMSHPDDRISFFNDVAFDVAASSEGVFAYARRLGFDPPREWNGPHYLEESGYCRLENERSVLICDVAPVGPSYQAGHAHADTLSFELSVDEFRVFVNSGVSEYGVTPERLRQRGTAAHNTVEVNNTNSSEVWSGFRLARRAFPFDISVQIDNPLHQTVTASHDGYKRLKGKPVHTRKWTLTEEVLLIEDNIDGNFSSALSHLHLHPDVTAELSNNCVKIFIPNGQILELTVSGGLARLEQSTWHPEFGKVIPSQKITINMHTATLVTTLQFNRLHS